MFRIGDFSRLARVTIRTLHHYDEAGLLQPAHVDEHTGYRYYAAAQLETLQRILLLKDLGFPLEEIRDLIDSGRCRRLTFLRRLELPRAPELEQSIAADQSRLRRLEALRDSIASSRHVSAPAVVLRETPAVEVLLPSAAACRSLGAPVQAMFEAAETAVATVREPDADASPFMIFHDAGVSRAATSTSKSAFR